MIYEEVSKIFRIDAVKTIQFTIRPIGRHHPWRSSLPSPPFLERFLEVLFCQSVKHSLRFGLDLFNCIKPASFQLQFYFFKQKKVTGCQIRGVRWVGVKNHLVFRQKLLGEDGSVRRGVSLMHRENRHRSCTRLQINACENCPRSPGYVQLSILTDWTW
jgi:hypothetical protein